MSPALAGKFLTTVPPGKSHGRLFDDSHSERCKVISHCGFDLHYSISDVEHISCDCWPSVCLWKNVYSNLLPTFQLYYLGFLDNELYELFVYFGY